MQERRFTLLLFIYAIVLCFLYYEQQSISKIFYEPSRHLGNEPATPSSSASGSLTSTTRRSLLLRTNTSIFDSCPLIVKDPWDEEFMRVLGYAKNFTCNEQELLTVIREGEIVLNTKYPGYSSYACQGRCLHYEHNYAVRAEQWLNIEGKFFDCDIVEVKCTKSGEWTVSYKYLHHQINEYSRDRLEVFGDLGVDTKANKVKVGQFHPNVYIVILDAMSMSAGYRQMPRTTSFLEEELQAVPFRFVSKVAENSKPNSIAFLFGEIPIAVDRSVFGVDDLLHHTLDEFESCDRPLDNESYVMFEYEDAGYKTMWACDFMYVNFGYTTCVGIKNQLSTHYMRPFQIRTAYEEDDELLMKNVIDSTTCREPYKYLLDYMGQFMDAYKGTPKMSVVWSVHASHDTEKGMAHTDDHFHDFFERNSEKLQDSFLVVMGDHGPRYDIATNTDQGLYDRMNPLMFVVLPKRLRGSKMHKVMKRNAEQLSSHHDLHATLVDIVRHQPQKDFHDTEFLSINGTYGSSWLREFEPGVPRNCRTLPIPSQYCLCDYGQKEIADELIKEEIGRRAVSDINEHLRERKVNDLCEEMEWEGTSKILSIPVEGYAAHYRVHFVSKRGAQIITSYVKKANGRTELLVREWDRTDRYGSQADCLRSEPKNYDLRILCFCRDQ